MEDNDQSGVTNPVASIGPQVQKAIVRLEAARDEVPPPSQDALENLIVVMSRCNEAGDEAEMAFVRRLLKITSPLIAIINKQVDDDMPEALRLAAIEIIIELQREKSVANGHLGELLQRLQKATFKAE